MPPFDLSQFVIQASQQFQSQPPAPPTPTPFNLEEYVNKVSADLSPAGLPDFVNQASQEFMRATQPNDDALLESIGAKAPTHYTGNWDYLKNQLGDPNLDLTTKLFTVLGMPARAAAVEIAKATGRPEQDSLMTQAIDAAVGSNTNVDGTAGVVELPDWWKEGVANTVGRDKWVVGQFLSGLLAPEVMPDPTSPVQFLKNYGLPMLAGIAGGLGDAALDPTSYMSFGAGRLGRAAEDVLLHSPESFKDLRLSTKNSYRDWVRRAPHLTENTVKDIAAPVLIDRRMGDWFRELTAQRTQLGSQLETALLQKDAPRIAEIQAQLGKMDSQFQAMHDLNEAVRSSRIDDFNKMLETARGLETARNANPIQMPKFSVAGPTFDQVSKSLLPETLLDASVPLDRRLEELAFHRAAFEHQLMRDLPGTRFLDHRIGPSPFHSGWSWLLGKLRGDFREVRSALTPLDQLGLEGQADQFDVLGTPPDAPAAGAAAVPPTTPPSAPPEATPPVVPPGAVTPPPGAVTPPAGTVTPPAAGGPPAAGTEPWRGIAKREGFAGIPAPLLLEGIREAMDGWARVPGAKFEMGVLEKFAKRLEKGNTGIPKDTSGKALAVLDETIQLAKNRLAQGWVDPSTQVQPGPVTAELLADGTPSEAQIAASAAGKAQAQTQAAFQQKLPNAGFLANNFKSYGAGESFKAWAQSLIETVQKQEIGLSTPDVEAKDNLRAFIQLQATKASAVALQQGIKFDDYFAKLRFKAGDEAAAARPDGSLRTGSITIDRQGDEMVAATINLFKSADLSTLVHESAHYLYQWLPEADRATVAKWAEAAGKDVNEAWAVGLENYLRTGRVTPREWGLDLKVEGKLTDIFERVKNFMVSVYQGLKEGDLAKYFDNAPAEFAPEVAEIFDRYLGKPARREAGEEAPVVTEGEEAVVGEEPPIVTEGEEAVGGGEAPAGGSTLTPLVREYKRLANEHDTPEAAARLLDLEKDISAHIEGMTVEDLDSLMRAVSFAREDAGDTYQAAWESISDDAGAKKRLRDVLGLKKAIKNEGYEGRDALYQVPLPRLGEVLDPQGVQDLVEGLRSIIKLNALDFDGRGHPASSYDYVWKAAGREREVPPTDWGIAGPRPAGSFRTPRYNFSETMRLQKDAPGRATSTTPGPEAIDQAAGTLGREAMETPLWKLDPSQPVFRLSARVAESYKGYSPKLVADIRAAIRKPGWQPADLPNMQTTSLKSAYQNLFGEALPNGLKRDEYLQQLAYRLDLERAREAGEFDLNSLPEGLREQVQGLREMSRTQPAPTAVERTGPVKLDDLEEGQTYKMFWKGELRDMTFGKATEVSGKPAYVFKEGTKPYIIGGKFVQEALDKGFQMDLEQRAGVNAEIGRVAAQEAQHFFLGRHMDLMWAQGQALRAAEEAAQGKGENSLEILAGENSVPRTGTPTGDGETGGESVHPHAQKMRAIRERLKNDPDLDKQLGLRVLARSGDDVGTDPEDIKTINTEVRQWMEKQRGKKARWTQEMAREHFLSKFLEDLGIPGRKPTDESPWALSDAQEDLLEYLAKEDDEAEAYLRQAESEEALNQDLEEAVPRTRDEWLEDDEFLEEFARRFDEVAKGNGDVADLHAWLGEHEFRTTEEIDDLISRTYEEDVDPVQAAADANGIPTLREFARLDTPDALVYKGFYDEEGQLKPEADVEWKMRDRIEDIAGNHDWVAQIDNDLRLGKARWVDDETGITWEIWFEADDTWDYNSIVAKRKLKDAPEEDVDSAGVKHLEHGDSRDAGEPEIIFDQSALDLPDGVEAVIHNGKRIGRVAYAWHKEDLARLFEGDVPWAGPGWYGLSTPNIVVSALESRDRAALRLVDAIETGAGDSPAPTITGFEGLAERAAAEEAKLRTGKDQRRDAGEPERIEVDDNSWAYRRKIYDGLNYEIEMGKPAYFAGHGEIASAYAIGNIGNPVLGKVVKDEVHKSKWVATYTTLANEKVSSPTMKSKAAAGEWLKAQHARERGMMLKMKEAESWESLDLQFRKDLEAEYEDSLDSVWSLVRNDGKKPDSVPKLSREKAAKPAVDLSTVPGGKNHPGIGMEMYPSYDEADVYLDQVMSYGPLRAGDIVKIITKDDKILSKTLKEGFHHKQDFFKEGGRLQFTDGKSWSPLDGVPANMEGDVKAPATRPRLYQIIRNTMPEVRPSVADDVVSGGVNRAAQEVPGTHLTGWPPQGIDPTDKIPQLMEMREWAKGIPPQHMRYGTLPIGGETYYYMAQIDERGTGGFDFFAEDGTRIGPGKAELFEQLDEALYEIEKAEKAARKAETPAPVSAPPVTSSRLPGFPDLPTMVDYLQRSWPLRQGDKLVIQMKDGRTYTKEVLSGGGLTLHPEFLRGQIDFTDGSSVKSYEMQDTYDMMGEKQTNRNPARVVEVIRKDTAHPPAPTPPPSPSKPANRPDDGMLKAQRNKEATPEHQPLRDKLLELRQKRTDLLNQSDDAEFGSNGAKQSYGEADRLKSQADEVKGQMTEVARQLIKAVTGEDYGGTIVNMMPGRWIELGMPEFLEESRDIGRAALETLDQPRMAYGQQDALPSTPGTRSPNEGGKKAPLRKLAAGDIVSGLKVRKSIPNQSSIGSSLSDYKIRGVREVPIANFDSAPHDLFYAKNDIEHVRNLSEQIRASKEISPLIVVRDAEGFYVLEGAHRLGALHLLNVETFPALLVDDLESLAQAKSTETLDQPRMTRPSFDAKKQALADELVNYDPDKAKAKKPKLEGDMTRLPARPSGKQETLGWLVDKVWGEDHKTMQPDSLEQLLIEKQVGRAAMHQGRTKGQLLAGDALLQWMKQYTQAFHPEDRADVIAGIKAVYEAIDHAHKTEGAKMKSPYKAVARTGPQRVAEALKTFDSLKDGKEKKTQKFWDAIQKRKQTGMDARDQHLASTLALQEKLQGSFKAVEHELRQHMADGNMVAFIDKVVESFVKSQVVNPKLADKFIDNLEELLETNGPWKYSVEWLERTNDIGGLAQELSDQMVQLLNDTNDSLINSKVTDGLDLLYKMGAGVWENVETAMGRKLTEAQEAARKEAEEIEAKKAADPSYVEPAPTDFTADARTKAAQQAKADLIKELRQRLADGKLEGADPGKRVAELEAWLNARSEDDMFALSRAMYKLADVRHEKQFRAAVERQMGQDLERYLAQATHTIREIRKRYVIPGESEWSQYRAVLEPTKMYEWYRGNIAEHVDKILGSVLRHYGIDHRAIERTESWESEIQAAKRDAVHRIFKDLVHGDMPKLLQAYGVAMDEATYGKTLDLVDQGFMKVVGYRNGLFSADAEVKKVAETRTAEGYDLLSQVLGPDKARIDKFNNDLLRVVQEKYTWPLFQAERKFGLPISYRQEYIPLSLRGTFDDVAELIDKSERLEQLTGEKRQPSLASPHVSNIERRSFQNAAELEVHIAKENAHRVANHLPEKKVEVNPSLVATMIQRRHLHNKALVNAQYLNDLKTLLPNDLMPFARVSLAEKNHLANKGWLDMGELAPQMTGWMVNKNVYNYLKSYMKGGDVFGSEIEHFGGVLTKTIMPILRILKHWNVSLDLVHLKNIAMLGLIGGVDWGLVKNNFKLALDANKRINGKKMARGSFERWASPFSPLADALEEHPLFELAVRHGLFPYGGLEVGMPLDTQVDVRMGRRPAWKMWFDGTGAPPNRLTFDLVDRSMRLALFEQYLKAGTPPTQAAKAANHYLLDYSMRWMTPQTRSWLYTLFPFAAWTVGNLKLHGTNMAMNPRWYMMLHRFNQEMNEEFSGIPTELMGGAIATSFATPFQGYQPELGGGLTGMLPDRLHPMGGNSQLVVSPQAPWQGTAKLIGDTVNPMLNWVGGGKFQPHVAAINATKWGVNRTWAPYQWAAGSVAPGVTDRAMDKSFTEQMMGKGRESGVVQDSFLWGIGGMTEPAYREIMYPLMSGEAFRSGMPFPGETLSNFLIRVRGMHPGAKFREM